MSETVPAPYPDRSPGKLSPRQERFCQIVASGSSFVDAYKIAYKKGRLLPNTARVGAKRVHSSEAVKWRIREIQGRSRAKALLTLNDRLEILAGIAQNPTSANADRIRAIDVYNKTAGDHAPERQEVTVKGDASAPQYLVTRPATKDEKVAALRAKRQKEEKAPP